MFPLRMIELRMKSLSFNLSLILLSLFILSLITGVTGSVTENQRLLNGETESLAAPITDLECDRAGRRIEIGVWGTIHIHDEFHVSNPTTIPIDSVTLSLPIGSQNVTASDVGGPIEVFIPSGSKDSPPRAIVFFRIVIKEDESYTFSVHFKIPASRNIELLGFDVFQLRFPLVPGLGASINTLFIEVVLPEGASLEEQTISPDPLGVEDEMLQKSALFRINDARFGDDRNLTLSYRYLIVWSAFRPTLWVGLLLGSLLLGRRILRIERFGARPDVIPLDLISSFVDAMDEQISLRAELASLKARVESRRVPKRQYRRRSRTIEKQISSLSRELNALKRELKNSGSKYLEMMKRLEVAEVGLETSEGNLDRLERRYRSGGISRSVYDRLKPEYSDRIQESKTVIDRVVIELREDTR